MTLKELKDRIKTLPTEKQEEINNLEATVNYPHLNLNKNLKGFVDIYRFVQKQHEGWSKFWETPEYFKTSKTYFTDILQKLNSYIQDGFGEFANRNVDRYLIEAIQYLEKDRHEINYRSNEKVFTYDASETVFLLELHRINSNSVETAIKVLIKESLRDINLNFDNYTGMQKAFEFLGQGEGKVRVEAEAKSIELLKNNFDTQIDDAEVKLETTIEKYTNWLTNTQESFKTFDEQSKQTITDKEELYDKMLQLKAPTKYWSERAEQLRKEGKKWSYWLISCSVIAVIILTLILYFISDGTLKELYERTGLAIRWSIVFITLISFLAYGIRTFAKLMFSTYHLARDAEERKQLTYVYLALVEEKAIDDTERHLVLQSLFSRADSGLLKNDTSPTMPGNILDKLSK